MWYQRSLGWWIAVDRTVSRMSSKLKLRLRDYWERGHSTWAAIWRDLGTWLHWWLDLIRPTHKTSPPTIIFREDQWRRLGNTSPRPGDHKKWKAALPLLVDEILAYNFFCWSHYSTSQFRAPGHLLFSSFLLIGSQDHQSNMPVHILTICSINCCCPLGILTWLCLRFQDYNCSHLLLPLGEPGSCTEQTLPHYPKFAWLSPLNCWISMLLCLNDPAMQLMRWQLLSTWNGDSIFSMKGTTIVLISHHC